MRNHLRSNVVGYVAVFIALSGTTYAIDGPLAGRNTVGSADIIDLEVQQRDIAANAIGTGKVSDESLEAGDIGAGQIGTSEVANDTSSQALTGLDVALNSLGAGDIGQDAVRTSEIGSDAVGSSEIAQDAVGASEIRTDAVGSSEIGPASVGVAELKYAPAGGAWGNTAFNRTGDPCFPTLVTAVPHNSEVLVHFNQELFNGSALSQPCTSVDRDYRLHAPANGLYLVVAHISWDHDPAGTRLATVTRNGNNIATSEVQPVADTGKWTQQTVTGLRALSQDDVIQLYAYQTSGDPLNIKRADLAIVRLTG